MTATLYLTSLNWNLSLHISNFHCYTLVFNFTEYLQWSLGILVNSWCSEDMKEGQRAGHSLRTRCMGIQKLALSLIICGFIKISSGNKFAWLVLIMSFLEWDIRLSIFHCILFGLDLQVWRFLRTFILNLYKESFYVPAVRLLWCMRSS